MRIVDYRFEYVRNGVPRGELVAVEDETATISMQADAEIPGSLQATFLYDPEVDYLLDRVRPYMWLDGQWHQLGEYMAASAEEGYTGSARHMSVEMMDLTLLAKQAATEGLLYLSAGTPYIQAIQQLVAGAGIGRLLYEATDDVLQTDREDWEEGTPYLTIINDLLLEIGYNPLWMDLNGNARLTRYRQAGAENIQHTYKSGESAIILPGCQISEDTFTLYNVFKAVCANPELEEPLSAVAVNDFPNSRTSTVYLGRRIPAPIEQLDNIASQEALQEYVERRRFESMLSTEKISFTTANVPTHGYMDIIALEHERLSGIYQETDWEMQLSYNGLMTHRARRVMFT